MVFRKDYDSHKENLNELLDANKSYVVGAGINTRDYAERVPALVEAGADVLCIDSSEGFSEWQKPHPRLDPRALRRYGEGRRRQCGRPRGLPASWPRLALTSSRSASAAAPSASPVRHKGIGRGQATAVIEVAKARDEYFKETGIYIPICSDGGIVHDYHITLALAMGADFVMLGRYFARFDESPHEQAAHQRQLRQGVLGRGFQPRPQLAALRPGRRQASCPSRKVWTPTYPMPARLKPTACRPPCTRCAPPCATAAALSIPELQEKARLTVVSSTSIVEGGSHDVILKNGPQNR